MSRKSANVALQPYVSASLPVVKMACDETFATCGLEGFISSVLQSFILITPSVKSSLRTKGDFERLKAASFTSCTPDILQAARSQDLRPKDSLPA